MTNNEYNEGSIEEEIIKAETEFIEKDSLKEEPKKKRSPLSIGIEIGIYALLLFICIYVVPTFVVQRTAVSGESMEETLHDGESMLINKLSYRFHDPERYDIIVFYPKGKEVDDSEYYVKRIYGLPGETVQIKENDIYINGKKIEDPYAKNAMDEAGLAAKPYKLKEDEFFVLGDNRQVSLDSRKIPTQDKEKYADMYNEEDLEYMSEDDAPGPVTRDKIEGKVFFRIWPLSEFGFVS